MAGGEHEKRRAPVGLALVVRLPVPARARHLAAGRTYRRCCSCRSGIHGGVVVPRAGVLGVIHDGLHDPGADVVLTHPCRGARYDLQAASAAGLVVTMGGHGGRGVGEIQRGGPCRGRCAPWCGPVRVVGVVLLGAEDVYDFVE